MIRPSLALLACLLVPVASAEDAPAPVASLSLTILHTNDIHGQVLPPAKGPGGLVALGRTIRQERDRARARGDAVLLLDAGDIFKGTPEGDLTNGQSVMAWMNHVGYDAMAIGNHEFDHGLDVVAKLCEAAKFPVLGANVTDGKGGPRPAWLGLGDASVGPNLRGCAIVRTLESKGGGKARVGVVGLTTSHMREVTLAGVTGPLEFADEVEVLTQVLDALGPVDLVVLVDHCGLDADREIAAALPGRIDVIVGGHSHTRLPEGKRAGSTLITQTGSRSAALGVVRVQLGPAASGARAVTSDAGLVAAGDDLEAALAPWIEEVGKKADREVGHVTVDLKRAGEGSTLLGNLHVDLMRAATGADLAFHNRTGIRADIGHGAVRWRDVYGVAPFGNTVSTLRMTGADVRALLEGMLGKSSMFLEVGGAIVLVDRSRPEGERVVECAVGGAPLDPAKVYLVATNNFLAPGGDGHVAFTRGTELKDTGKVLLDLLLEHFAAHDPWDPGALEERLLFRREK
jgi:5'-nucleotidase/UDP-sugar diphosphatase